MRSNSPEVARRVRRSSLGHSRTTAGAVLAGVVLGALAAAAQSAPSSAWWAPGQGTPLPGYATYENERGQVGLLNVAGPIETKGHPFFEPIGTNGRACVTCHQPSDAMALSLRSVRERWTATGGTDPLFAAVDGMNCPNLPAGRPAVALAAARARPVPHRAAVAAAARGRHADRAGVHDRGGARSDGLQYRSGLRAAERERRPSPSSAARGRSPTRSTRRTRTSASVRSSARTACRRRSIQRPAGRPA